MQAVLFPAAMSILVGIDLLAKFYTGTGTDKGGVGDKFMDFTSTSS
jgi:hypothetical protein